MTPSGLFFPPTQQLDALRGCCFSLPEPFLIPLRLTRWLISHPRCLLLPTQRPCLPHPSAPTRLKSRAGSKAARCRGSCCDVLVRGCAVMSGEMPALLPAEMHPWDASGDACCPTYQGGTPWGVCCDAHCGAMVGCLL